MENGKDDYEVWSSAMNAVWDVEKTAERNAAYAVVCAVRKGKEDIFWAIKSITWAMADLVGETHSKKWDDARVATLSVIGELI